MFKWTEKKIKNVNGIKFGMSRKEVREIIGRIYFEFKKTKFSKTTSDNFGICHVFYNTQDEFEAIEIFDEVYVIIEGKQIFPADIAVLAELSEDFIKEDDFYISKSKSIGIYAPSGKMESILFGVKDYY